MNIKRQNLLKNSAAWYTHFYGKLEYDWIKGLFFLPTLLEPVLDLFVDSIDF
jgi:hypothetical protein